MSQRVSLNSLCRVLPTGLRRVTLCLLCPGSLREGSNAKSNKPPLELSFIWDSGRISRGWTLPELSSWQSPRSPRFPCSVRPLLSRAALVALGYSDWIFLLFASGSFSRKEVSRWMEGRKGLAKDLEPSRCSHGTRHSSPCGKQNWEGALPSQHHIYTQEWQAPFVCLVRDRRAHTAHGLQSQWGFGHLGSCAQHRHSTSPNCKHPQPGLTLVRPGKSSPQFLASILEHRVAVSDHPGDLWLCRYQR